MDKFYFSILVAVIIGILDIIPMMIKKLPKYTISASFIHFFVTTIIIMNTNLTFVAWWFEGAVIGFLLMLPMLIHVAHQDKKSLPIITFNAILFGVLAKASLYFI